MYITHDQNTGALEINLRFENGFTVTIQGNTANVQNDGYVDGRLSSELSEALAFKNDDLILDILCEISEIE